MLQYLKYLATSEKEMVNEINIEEIYDKKNFIKKYKLNDKKYINRYKLPFILAKFIPISFIGAIIASEFSNPFYVTFFLIIMFSFIFASLISLFMNGTIEQLINDWKKKEWEFYTKTKYFSSNLGLIPIDSVAAFGIFAYENKKVLKKLSKMNDKQRSKFIRRTICPENI